MKKEDIHLYDLLRILQGNVPAVFYVELIIRGLFVYFVITFGMKYMGKRISAELTRSELAATSSLAAATGLVLMAPDRGILPPVIVLLVMLGIKQAMDKLNYKNEKFEHFTVGHFSNLIENGVLKIHEMKMTRMSREQLFAQLRESGVIQLGTIKRFYIEANGSFTLVKNPEKQPGLPVIPPWDTDFLDTLKLSSQIICSHCGKTKGHEPTKCSNCGSDQWQKAVED